LHPCTTNLVEPDGVCRQDVSEECQMRMSFLFFFPISNTVAYRSFHPWASSRYCNACFCSLVITQRSWHSAGSTCVIASECTGKFTKKKKYPARQHRLKRKKWEVLQKIAAEETEVPGRCDTAVVPTHSCIAYKNLKNSNKLAYFF